MNDLTELFYEQLRLKDDLAGFKITAVSDSRQVMTLLGEVSFWQQVVDIGHLAGRLPGIKGVVNKISVSGLDLKKCDRTAEIEAATEKGVIDTADIVIIGAGVSGSGIARTLAKYNKKIVVLERNSDVSEGTSKANNGMIHSGYDSKAGSLKALLNVKGNAMYSKWQEELNFKMNRCGSFVVGFDESDDAYLEEYLSLGEKNGVPGIEILTGDEARKIEPALNHDIVKALWTPSAAYVEPYEVVEALMENAIDNGVTLRLDTEVLAFEKKDSNITGVLTSKGIIETKCVINAAGVYADDIAEMAGDRFYTIHPRRGTLVILDKNLSSVCNKAFIGTPPKNFTKGGGPTQSPEGNPLWGPSAIEVPEKDDLGADEEDVRFVMEKGKHLTEGASEKDIITFFS
ncbi:MAG: FAD-dependent oxidoreductase, partial [Eubacterium sp.]